MITLLLASACHIFGGTVKDPDIVISKEISTELSEIKKAYKAPECYSATFSIKGKSVNQSTQSASGSILADNLQNRLRMEFKVPFLGIVISRMIVKDKTVFLNDVYHNKKYTYPLNQFALGGMNRSSIPLPFSIFQDMLYARLPERVHTGSAKRNLDGKILLASWQEGYKSYVYKFDSRMLKQMKYTYARDNINQQVLTNLSGRFPGTGFPRSIQIKSDQPGNPNPQAESMLLRFNSVNLNAKCLNSRFVPD